jgi:ABC-2 type transport system ATP-binding protein
MNVPYGPPAPALIADRLLAAGPRGVIVGPVSLAVAPGEVLAIAGAGGSGRTSLLLALAGRLRIAGGRVTVTGGSSGGGACRTYTRALRRAVSVGRAGAVMDLDELWTVGDALADRAVLAQRPVEPAVRGLLATAGVDLPSTMPLHAVDPLQATLLHAALAAAEERRVLVVDDVDRGLRPEDEARAWSFLAAIAAEGRAVVGATSDASAARAAGATVLDLGALPA